MSSSDGHVLSSTKIVDNGPNSDRWNLVIIGDGYRETEITKYHTDVENFLATFRATAPFGELFSGINVFRIDVVSTDSGADDPGCGGGSPVTARTFFDATFCSRFGDRILERLLTVNNTLAISVADTHVQRRHQILCIVNASKSGGSGGTIATCSADASAALTAIHEMGHSAFGLADEYGGDGSATPVGEPREPNVTRETNRANNKWRGLISPTTPMPSQCEPSCTASTCIPPATPATPGAVGTYEGAMYSNCNVYRPFAECKMRGVTPPFCPVCESVIRAVLEQFVPS